jgi:hypothetical protein
MTRKLKQKQGSIIWTTIEEGRATIARLERCTRSLVLIVEKKTKYRSSRTGPDRYTAGIATGIAGLRGISRQ